MRREVARAAVTAAWIALAVFAVPLAVAVWLLLVSDEQGELERAALRAAVHVDPAYVAGAPVRFETPPREITIGLYDQAGHLRAGAGPATADPVTRQAWSGQVSQGRTGGALVVGVPSASGPRVTGVVRASSPMVQVWRRAVLVWLLLLALAFAALLAAIAVARRQARRLVAPLEALAAASQAIGDGDFSVTVPPSGIEELDRVGATQNETTRRLEDLLRRERQFSADASHQLRTPLAGLQLILENAGPGSHEEALATTRRLRATVDDVLAAHRQQPDLAPGLRAGVADVIGDAVALCRPPGRSVTALVDPAVAARAVPSVRVGQILDVLLDNAVRHGSGAVTVQARPLGSAVAIDVRDEGAGITAVMEDVFRRGAGAQHGIGLALARELAESLGGRLLLSRRTPPTFTLTLPTDPGRPADDQPTTSR